MGYRKTVLQYSYYIATWECRLGKDCIAIQILYCRLGGWAVCIAIHWTVLWLEWLHEAKLYRNTKLYYDRRHGCWAGVGRRCWACRALGERAQGADARHGQARRQAGARRARGRRAAAALGRRCGCAGARGARRQARQVAGSVRSAQAGVGGERGEHGWAHGARGARPAGQHGRVACAHRLGQLGARAPGLVFNLVFRLGIFPKSLNEHCSL